MNVTTLEAILRELTGDLYVSLLHEAEVAAVTARRGRRRVTKPYQKISRISGPKDARRVFAQLFLKDPTGQPSGNSHQRRKARRAAARLEEVA